MQEASEILTHLVGADHTGHGLALWQILARTALIYAAGLVLVRAGKHRFLGKNTAFDVVLAFVLGAILSRAINGNAPFYETIAAAALLMGLHWVMTMVAVWSDRADRLFNGRPVEIVHSGERVSDVLRQNRVSDTILAQNLRESVGQDTLEGIDRAYLERDGTISFLPAAREARVVEVRVEDGVQTVRVEIAPGR